MKRTVLPLGFDGAYLQPHGYVPGCAQTTYESYDSWVMGVEMENARSSMLDILAPVIDGIVDALKSLAPKFEALARSVESEKAKERQRSRDDLNRKRREMRRRKGRLA